MVGGAGGPVVKRQGTLVRIITWVAWGLLGLVFLRVLLVSATWDWDFVRRSLHVVLENLPLLLVGRFPAGQESLWGLGGLGLSVLLALVAMVGSFGLGLVAGIARLSARPYLRHPAVLYIEIIRGTPLIMVIFWFYFFLPILTGRNFSLFTSAVVSLTMFSGAYLAEIVRAGIQAVPAGQREAALATGLTSGQVLRHIVLPQALQIMIPALVSQFIALFKDTSLAFVIGVTELMAMAQAVNNREIYYPFAIYLTVGLLYFIACFALSRLARRLERRLPPGTLIEVPS